MKNRAFVVSTAGVLTAAGAAIGIKYLDTATIMIGFVVTNILMMFLLTFVSSVLQELTARLKPRLDQRNRIIHTIRVRDGNKSYSFLVRYEKKRRVKRPPGFRLLHFVEFFYSRKAIEEVFKPILADWQFEYYECLKENCLWQARWTTFRWTIRFILAMGLTQAIAFLRDFVPFGRAKS
jgi:hypothetical protein